MQFELVFFVKALIKTGFRMLLLLLFSSVLLYSVQNVKAQQKLNLDSPLSFCFVKKENNISQLKIASDNEGLFLAFHSNELKKLNASGFNVEWSFLIGGVLISDIIVSQGTDKAIFIATKTFSNQSSDDFANNPSLFSAKTIVRSVNSLTGVTNWQFTMENSAESSNSVFLHVEGNKLFALLDDGKIFVINNLDGKLIWRTSFEGNLSAKPVFAKKTILAAQNKVIKIYSNENGKFINSIKAPEKVTALFVNDGGQIFWGDQRGGFYAWDIALNKQLWKFSAALEISNVLTSPEGILITSFDNFIYFVEQENGKRIWKKRLSGRVITPPLIYDKFVLITSIGENRLSILDLVTGRLVNQILVPETEFIQNQPLIVNDKLILSTLNHLYFYSENRFDCGNK